MSARFLHYRSESSIGTGRADAPGFGGPFFAENAKNLRDVTATDILLEALRVEFHPPIDTEIALEFFSLISVHL